MYYKTIALAFVFALLADVALLGREGRLTTAKSGASSSTVAVEEKRWYVYSDAAPGDGKPENHGHFTNFMAEKNKTDMLRLSLVESENPYAGETCIRVEMDFRKAGWGGLAVSSAPDYWGATPGPAFELSKAKKLVFYARGSKGKEMIQAKVAITGEEPYGDRPKTSFDTQSLSLSNEWKRFELPVSGFTRLVTPFVFVSNRPSNRDETITFFLDEIYFITEEGTKTRAVLAPTPAPAREKSTFHSYLSTSNPNAALIAYTGSSSKLKSPACREEWWGTSGQPWPNTLSSFLCVEKTKAGLRFGTFGGDDDTRGQIRSEWSEHIP